MEFHRRRIANSLFGTPCSTSPRIDPRNVVRSPASATGGYTSNPTIAPYATALHGVNQPANFLFQDILWASLGVVGGLILLIRIVELVWAWLRRIHAMQISGVRQGYWKFKQWTWMPSLKKNLWYAPLWKKRHNREIRLSTAGNVGTLPSRLHFFLLFLYGASNITYMFVVDWSKENKWSLCAELRGRSGTLSVVNMIPLIIFAGRNNPLISWLQISFDTYNLFHRWLGRTAVIEAMIHVLMWTIVQVADGGWGSVFWKTFHDSFCAAGMVGAVAMVALTFLSLSPIRHAFYETFLNSHIILALVIFICTWVHCVVSAKALGVPLPQLPYMQTILVLWFFDRLARMLRLVHYNWSKERGMTEAVCEALPGDAIRVTMHLARHVDVKPGTHAYIRLASLGIWESHPFSIAWVDHTYEDSDDLPLSSKELLPSPRPISTSVSFIIGAQTGFTRRLYDAANKPPTKVIKLKGGFEGPYAGHHSMDSYGHAVLFAGSTGITHQISYLRHLIQGFNDETVATRRVTLVWIVRDTDALEWVRPWMDTILRMPRRKEILQIRLFVTRPKNPKQISSASNTVQMFSGRPNVSALLAKEVQEQMGAMCVSVCGPGALSDDVRAAVREAQDHRTVVDFVEESFTW